jgi:type III restriction enzyme
MFVVEYKGADRYAAAKMDRDLGELWAELSDGKCRFVMVTDKQWGEIEGGGEVASGGIQV